MLQLQKKQIKKFFKAFPKRAQEICVILENIQYARNVAEIFRIADASRVKTLYLTGISQTPPFGKDLQKVSRHKETTLSWESAKDAVKLIRKLKGEGFVVVAIEITDKSIPLRELPEALTGKNKICFVGGSEVYGITKKTLAACDMAVYIPMYGKGASLNVAVSLGIVLYSY